MSLIPHHTSDLACALCELKLKDAHPDLVKWFQDLKSRHPDVHVSWSYRDQASQEKAFSDGATKLHYPLSAHNHSVQGEPQALALDIFQIDDSGRGKWDPVFCAKVNAENEAAAIPLKWGGLWKSLGDCDHFQIATD